MADDDMDILENWTKYCWDIADAYFKQHGIVQQHLDSFNEFLPDIIRKLIAELPPIEIKDVAKTRHTFHFPGLQEDSSVIISPPKFTEEDSISAPVFPSIARARNFTYSSSVYCRIRWTRKKSGKAEQTMQTESQKLRFIGKVPIMVRSNSCNLKRLTDANLYNINECPLDPGGYFIVNGKERVIIAQERASNNTIFVFPPHSDSKNLLECEIRSTIEKSSASAHAFWVHLSAPKKHTTHNKLKLCTPRLKVKLPSLIKTVDITIFFQALGFESDREIMKNIIEGEETSDLVSQLLRTFLERSFRTQRLSSQEEAKCYLGDLSIKPELDNDERRQFTEHLLNKEFLPHLGVETSDFRKKGYFLCHMIRRLLMVYASFRSSDDRDHLQNKRYFFSGPLMSQMFYRTLRTMHSELRMALERQILQRKPINLDLAINTSVISKGMAFSLATGNWGDLRKATTRIYKGVSQELNRLTYASLISSLRRVNSPEDKLHLMVKPRQLHNTYFGMICPCETPEGKSVGLVKNLALQAIITVGSNPLVLEKYLFEECGLRDVLRTIDSAKRDADVMSKLTKVFVNGVWVGFHKNPTSLIDFLRQQRRLGSGNIPHQTSICWDCSTKEIEIRTDAGRICRPLMIVKDNELLVTAEHIALLKSDPKFGWQQLLLEGVVEMVDVRESENALIAMYPNDLTKSRTDSSYKYSYTHMEIHPSLMLGICAAVIPYVEHNQSPRNVYQSAIAKQALGVYVTNFHTRMDTSAHVLFYPQKPLVSTRATDYARFRELPAGTNCIVAIATYLGYNQEDSLILNRSALDRGLFRSMFYHTYQDKAERNTGRGDQDETFGVPDRSRTKGVRLVMGEGDTMVRYSKLEEDGIAAPGTALKEDEAIIGKTMRIPHLDIAGALAMKAEFEAQFQKKLENSSRNGEPRRKQPIFNIQSRLDKSTYLKKPDNGVVDQSLVTTNSDGLRLVKVRVRTMLTPTVGDKFASLHGQKGVAGMIFREEDLYFTGQGIIPDIIINPHGIPSRMTIGQLIESLCGKGAAIVGEIEDGTPFDRVHQESSVIRAKEILTKNGFNKIGNEVLYCGHTGRKLNAQVFIGPTYYQRLRHLVDDKIHSRARGSVNVLTRQPVQGFARDGGLRFGEMERDCVISHGTALFLMERMLDVSDVYLMHVCTDCGLIVSTRPVHEPRKPCFVCTSCPVSNNSIGASTVKVPYAAKLLIQELMCMNIAVRVMV